ncbi:hypothetical protein P3X46_007686 [Hevea brasiliensis]|uniref:3'-5' exonuclease domain-containing protein n=1 Tax=Hevea brasiliensis TaxID=3981 RepID=A0ABQ9MUA3_HEVBR|nr:hypothetical protein P3X46_007686 [Hevea brasiliensis]
MSFPGLSSTYNIQYHGDHIFATFTPSAAIVDEWIANILRINSTNFCRVAIIQLCVGKRCLIFQLYHADYIPPSLIQFLSNKKFTFVGTGVRDDAYKVFQDYELLVAHTKDVDHRRMDLKALVDDLLEKVIPKPREITMSEWNAKQLTIQQIQMLVLMPLCPFILGFS